MRRAATRLGVLFAATAALLAVTAARSPGPAPAGQAGGVGFAVYEVWVEAASPLAAWQFELEDGAGSMTVVGVEGGEHPAFRAAPYYDPAALRTGRIVVAAFSTADALPSGRTRVATLHLRVREGVEPDPRIELTAAAGPGGAAVDGRISLVKGS